MIDWYKPEHFKQVVRNATSYAAKDGAMQIRWDAGIGVWSLRRDESQPRTRTLFAVVTADGTMTPGPAFDPAFK